MKRTLRLLSIPLFLMMLTVLLGGCNTVEGAGRDIEGVGNAVQDAAD